MYKLAKITWYCGAAQKQEQVYHKEFSNQRTFTLAKDLTHNGETLHSSEGSKTALRDHKAGETPNPRRPKSSPHPILHFYR